MFNKMQEQEKQRALASTHKAQHTYLRKKHAIQLKDLLRKALAVSVTAPAAGTFMFMFRREGGL